jgi:hypothetical protein
MLEPTKRTTMKGIKTTGTNKMVEDTKIKEGTATKAIQA